MSSVAAAIEAAEALAGWDPADTNQLHEDLVALPGLPDALRDALAHIAQWMAENAHLKDEMAEAVHAAATQAGSMADDLQQAIGGGITGEGGGGRGGGGDPRPDWVVNSRPEPPPERPSWVDNVPYGQDPRPPPPPPPVTRPSRPPPDDPPDPPPPAGVREPRRPGPRRPGGGAARRTDSPMGRWRLAA